LREIVFDTETTGLSFTNDRVVEIGAVELVDLLPTGKSFHVYINPQMPMPKAAERIHGLSTDFLKRKPTFEKVIDRFMAFIDGAQLVAHNSDFDIGMMNGELSRLGRPALSNPVVNTLTLAREVKKGGRHNLDALLSFFGIDNSDREFHGALKDSDLLAKVYLELRGGRQFALNLAAEARRKSMAVREVIPMAPYRSRASDDEIQAHAAFVKQIGQNAIWNRYFQA
jgi:DNA polymerase-3 subunit epsilon